MGLFTRRRKLPAANRPPLEPDERVLSWAEVANGGGAIVTTNLGLWLPGRSHRLGWHEVNKAVWSGREMAVTPAERVGERDGYQVVADCPVETYLLLEPGQVPHHVRMRVTKSVAYTNHHRLPVGGVRVAARRVTGADGVTWTVRYDAGTDAADEQVRAETARLIAAARDSVAPAD